MLKQKRKRVRTRKTIAIKQVVIVGVGGIVICSIVGGSAFLLFARKDPVVSPVPIVVSTSGEAHAVKAVDDQIKLQNLLETNGFIVTSIAVSEDGAYIVKLKSEEEIIFSSTKSFLKQISSLQLILSRLTIEGKKIKRLDLRFDKPVVISR